MVRLTEIVFENRNNIEVLVTIEAPVGRRVVTHERVPLRSTYRVSPGVDDCRSVRFEVEDGTHSSVRQEFGVAQPSVGQPSYIAHLTAHHVVGSIDGTVIARTEDANTTDDEFLRDVERDNTGRVVALSRWGWKRTSLDGRTVLVAATRDEALEALRAAGETEPDVLLDGCASKDPNNIDCYKKSACKKTYCISRSLDTGIRVCVCTDSPR